MDAKAIVKEPRVGKNLKQKTYDAKGCGVLKVLQRYAKTSVRLVAGITSGVEWARICTTNQVLKQVCEDGTGCV